LRLPFSGSRRAALILAPALAVAISATGCATGDEGIQRGGALTVYLSMPLRGTEAPEGRDVVDGARLALDDAHGRVGQIVVNLVQLDDTGAGGDWSQSQTAANARRATEDSTAIAYVGDFDSGATRSSLPITNQAHLLQVSPASSAIDLVQPYLNAGNQVPDVQPTGARTFGRVIPSDPVQAEAGAAWAKRLGAQRVGVVQGNTRFGQAMATAFKQAANGIRITHRDADLIYDATAPDYRIGAGGPFVPPGGPPVMGTDALLGPVPQPVRPPTYVTSAAEDPSQLPPAGQRFVRDFRRRYGGEPGRYAAYGYEAMAVVLDSIHRAGDSGDDRQAVIDAFFATTDRESILGTYSIDELGNTTLDRMAGYRIVSGRPRFDAPLRARP
jgi:branched-chain amino acid transport system substrate-binding protein